MPLPGSSAVERRAVNADVGGSSPPPAASKKTSEEQAFFCFKDE